MQYKNYEYKNITFNYAHETAMYHGFYVPKDAFYGCYKTTSGEIPFVSNGKRDKFGNVEVYAFYKKKKQTNAKWQQYNGSGFLATALIHQREVKDAELGRRSEYHSMSYIPQKKHNTVIA